MIENSQIIVFQPALPAYRLDFFDRAEQLLDERVTVHYSPTDMGTLTVSVSNRRWAKRLPPMRPLFWGLEWQPGVLSTPIKRGDIVVLSGAPRNISNMLMLIWARTRGAQAVWWGHYWSSTSKAYRFLLRLQLLKMANAVLFYTDREVEEYRASHGKQDCRIVTALNNGINVEPIAALREPYSAEAREKAILFIGRLTEKAELPVLLRALTNQRLQDARLEVVGDGPEKGTLEALAKELGVDERIVWHGGTTDEKVIADIANRCRLFVYPGGVGLSLLHAMAYGLPAVVHDDRWNHMPEIAAFYSANSGLSFIHGDPASLANAILAALEVTATDSSWSETAARVTESQFNTGQMANRFCALIKQLRTSNERNGS